MHNYLGKQFSSSLKSWTYTLPFNPAILILGIYTRETKGCVHTHTQIVGKCFSQYYLYKTKAGRNINVYKQVEWKNKFWYIHTVEYVPFDNKKEQTTNQWENMDGSQNSCTK